MHMQNDVLHIDCVHGQFILYVLQQCIVLNVLLLTYMTGGMYEVEPVKVIITRNKVIEVS